MTSAFVRGLDGASLALRPRRKWRALLRGAARALDISAAGYTARRVRREEDIDERARRLGWPAEAMTVPLDIEFILPVYDKDSTYSSKGSRLISASITFRFDGDSAKYVVVRYEDEDTDHDFFEAGNYAATLLKDLYSASLGFEETKIIRDSILRALAKPKGAIEELNKIVGSVWSQVVAGGLRRR